MTLLVANTPKELKRLQKNTQGYVEPITAITVPYLGEHQKEHYDLIVFSNSVSVSVCDHVRHTYDCDAIKIV